MNRIAFWTGLVAGIVLTVVVTQSELVRTAVAGDKKSTDAVEGNGEQKAEAPLLYELRTYYTPDGKLEDLNARFRNHTMKLFEKHGMKNIMYWVPVDKPNTLIYVIAHKDQAAAEASWAAFRGDPEWKKVAAETERNGKIVEKVESVYMLETDYSPKH